MVNLAILYEPERGRPLLLANITDRQLLVTAAHIALEEAEAKYAYLVEADKGLALVQREEVERLRRALAMFIPELQAQLKEKKMAALGFVEDPEDDHALVTAATA